jgi:DNA-binding beta-propeller fold protein YncE
VGRTTANPVVLTETVPAGTTLVGPLGLWHRVGTSNVYTYAAGSLAAGAGSSVSFRVRVDNPFQAGDRVLNTVYIGSRSAECNVLNNTSTDETPVAGAGPGGHVIYLPIVVKGFANAWATLQWVDQSTDRVSLADDGAGLAADGRADGRWTLVVNPGTGTTKTISRLALTSSQGPGIIWDTVPSNLYSVIGVYSGATLLNAGNGSFTRLVSGDTSFSLFTSDTNPFTLFPPDQYDYTITVTFSDSTFVVATARIPAAPQPPSGLAYVSDVAVDPVSDRVFVASPAHDWVYMLANDALAGNVGVSHGPTGLDVLTRTAGSKVFVAHAFDWEGGARAFDAAGGASRLVGPEGGYVGSGPYRLAVNSTLGRAYVSNYFDKLAVINTSSETRLGWVVQKGWQGAYGIDVSHATGRVYLATIDTGELVVFDGNGDRLLQSNYIPTHFKPPEGQACSLYSVAVNERTGHVFVPCPARKLVWVLKESDLTILEGMAALGEIGILEEREGGLALVIDAQAVSWTPINLVSYGVTTSLGKEGIAVDPLTNRVFIGDPEGDKLVVLQDVTTPTLVSVFGVAPVGDNPQGVDVNPDLHKAYVGNAGSNTLTVLNTFTPTPVITTINLTP